MVLMGFTGFNNGHILSDFDGFKVLMVEEFVSGPTDG